MPSDVNHSYSRCLEFLYSRNQFSIKMGLERIQSFLELLGNPQDSLRCIQVGGTNGKGSVCRYLSAMLSYRGCSKVGLYTSPHLVSFRERISVNQAPISKEWLVQWLERYQNAIEERGLTYFEIVTAMALHYFADRGCDAVVLEVGLGGRLDATTAITPSLCVVTSVGFDHMDVLGNTIEDIWEEKIGILKPGIPMVTGEKRAHLISRLHERAKALASPIYVIENSLPQSMFASNPGITSKVTQWNCTLAWKALECWEKHVSVKELSQDRVQSDMEKCLSKITPALGRQTYIQSSMNTSAPPLLLDGAHNAEGVDALKHFVQKLPTRKWIVLYASMSDKDWERGLVVAEAIAGKGHKKIFQTLPQYSRALSYETMRRSEYCQDTSNWKCWDEALSQEKTSELLLEAKREGKGILVFGSFYLLGEFIPFLVDVYPELNWYKQFREEWEGDINP